MLHSSKSYTSRNELWHWTELRRLIVFCFIVETLLKSDSCHLTIAIPVYVKGELQRQNKFIHLKGRPKSCRKRPKSLKSAKPFSRYSTLKIEIWTILREKRQKNQKCCFLEVLHKLKNNRLCDVRNDKCTIQQ